MFVGCCLGLGTKNPWLGFVKLKFWLAWFCRHHYSWKMVSCNPVVACLEIQKHHTAISHLVALSPGLYTTIPSISWLIFIWCEGDVRHIVETLTSYIWYTYMLSYPWFCEKKEKLQFCFGDKAAFGLLLTAKIYNTYHENPPQKKDWSLVDWLRGYFKDPLNLQLACCLSWYNWNKLQFSALIQQLLLSKLETKHINFITLI